MSDEKALLAAIWEHPHDDTVRLAYADWLDEHEQPDRAEFIRVQVELSQFDRWDRSPQKLELEKRDKQLWAKHAKEWKADLPANLQKTAGFHRGFPKPQPRTLTAAKFLAQAADEFAAAPLWDVRLSPNHRMLSKVLACPHLLRVGALDFRYWLETPDDVRAFATSPFVRNVAALNASSSGFGNAGMASLVAQADNLSHLRGLDLEFSNLTARAMATLTGSSLAAGLRSLRLWSNPLGSDGILALASSPRLTALERLDLTHCERIHEGEPRPISREAIAALCASPYLAALKELAFDPRHFGPEGAALLCATQPVFRLRALRLSSTDGVQDEGAAALAAWSGLEEVRELSLYANKIGDRGALALARSPYLNNITELRLDLNQFGTAATTALIERFGPDAVRV